MNLQKNQKKNSNDYTTKYVNTCIIYQMYNTLNT